VDVDNNTIGELLNEESMSVVSFMNNTYTLSENKETSPQPDHGEDYYTAILSLRE
jgi:hypothetical protein